MEAGRKPNARSRQQRAVLRSESTRRPCLLELDLRRLPGRRLFRYRSEGGVLRQANAHDVSRFLREIAGVEISLKDFRTLLASVAVLDALACAARGSPRSKSL